jgi:hypothetical protein
MIPNQASSRNGETTNHTTFKSDPQKLKVKKMIRQESEKSDKMNDGLIVDYEVFKKVTRNVLLNANVFRHKNIRTSHGPYKPILESPQVSK